MQPDAYRAMRVMQAHHWWWRGMRHLYRAALCRVVPAQPACRVIDVGCGFGANFPVLNPVGQVVGVDVSFEALQAIERRPALGLVQAQADALPFRARSFGVVATLAIIEHSERDDHVLAETHRVARPGAIQILLTSAFMLLWSHHDVANEHRRRYRGEQLDRLMRGSGWRVVRTGYVNVFVFPAVALVRIVQRRSHTFGESTYDMGPDLGPFNRVLETLLRVEAWLFTRTAIRFPFGVDLFSISTRDG
jgi:SAM-dependent methyltransferase